MSAFESVRHLRQTRSDVRDFPFCSSSGRGALMLICSRRYLLSTSGEGGRCALLGASEWNFSGGVTSAPVHLLPSRRVSCRAGSAGRCARRYGSAICLPARGDVRAADLLQVGIGGCCGSLEERALDREASSCRHCRSRRPSQSEGAVAGALGLAAHPHVRLLRVLLGATDSSERPPLLSFETITYTSTPLARLAIVASSRPARAAPGLPGHGEVTFG